MSFSDDIEIRKPYISYSIIIVDYNKNVSLSNVDRRSEEKSVAWQRFIKVWKWHMQHVFSLVESF
jgi:hypothetical protein